MDVDSIALGRDFRSVLQQTLASCDVMLVLIDKNWAEGHAKERLNDPNDYVRMEIEAALKRDIPVTPILLRGANMPAAEQLPDEIRDLAYRNAFELSHNRWESDVQELIRRLGLDATGASPPSARQPAAGAGQGITPEPVRKALFHRRLFWVAPAALVLAAIVAAAWGYFTMTREATDSTSTRPAEVEKLPVKRDSGSGNGAPATPTNDFRNLNVTEVSPNELRVSAEYTYTGDLGERPPIVPSVTSNNATNPEMVYENSLSNRPAVVGTSQAVWTIYGDLSKPWISDQLGFCIVDTSRARPPFCESFPYRKEWSVPVRQGVVGNDLTDFQALDVSDSELLVSTKYEYEGTSGQRPFRVYMSAVALQEAGQQVPGTHFEGFGGPGPVRLGSGRSMMLIRKVSGAAGASDSVRVCINSQNSSGQLNQVICKSFPHHKQWR
jgi:hypothetical protein